jgi:hypothetical protein
LTEYHSSFRNGSRKQERERDAGAQMIVRTLGSACRLLEIHWQKGREAGK